MALRYAVALLLSIPMAWSFDPAGVLAYSTYLRDGFTPSAVTTDAAGNVYIVGSVIVDASAGQLAAMVMKLNPTGTQFIYTRTLGGSLNDTGLAIAVDGAGNAYVTGLANSPDFPVTAGRTLATPPSGPDASGLKDARTFLVKLDPQGSIVFSDFLGASVYNFGQAVAVTAPGEILVSGTANSGFPVTAGAYNATGTGQRPYLLELDPTGATVKFSAFGIGGSALATDASGNIYMAGSTLLLDYPTTPGAYQPVFKLVTICYGFCRIAFPATNQYLTKLDPTGTKLIYSTAVPGNSGQTTNAGLAVDAAGNAYLTGLAFGSYPYSAKPPDTPEVRPFLTKLDPGGQRNLFSVAIGGAGVALDEKGHVIVSGSYNNLNLSGGVPFPQVLLPGLPPGVTALPQQCQENDVTTTSQAYVSQVDSETGNALSTVLVDASNLTAIGVALAGSAVWLAGIADQADVPITPGALAPLPLKAGLFPGAYLGQADFSLTSATGAPSIACVLDAANTARAGPVAINQLLTLIGQNLGPDPGVAATNSTTTDLGGVSVAFDGNQAPILYASSSQINVAVPFAAGGQNSTVMQVTVNGVSAPPRELPLVPMVPSLFANLTTVAESCAGQGTFEPAAFVPLALGQDGTPNSCQHPGEPGDVVSFFVNGIGGQSRGNNTYGPYFGSSIPVVAQIGPWSAEVVAVTMANDFVWRVDVQVPALPPGTAVTEFQVRFLINSELGPVEVGPIGVGSVDAPLGVPDVMMIWVGPSAS